MDNSTCRLRNNRQSNRLNPNDRIKNLLFLLFLNFCIPKKYLQRFRYLFRIDVFSVIFLEKEIIVGETGEMDFLRALVEHLF